MVAALVRVMEILPDDPHYKEYKKTYLEMMKALLPIQRADGFWNAMANEAVHPDGFLGYTQGTGKQPSDSQDVSYTSKPDFEDYGFGCYLLPA
jgi:unsaturated rhamnogalacturonyl hydrolase